MDVITETVIGKKAPEMFKHTRIKIVHILQLYCNKGKEKRLRLHSADINHSYDLKECYDEQRHRAHIAVKDLHPVVPRTKGKDESDQE